ncbi:MAG: thioredoxin family protein [Enterobacter sp.]
MFLTPDDFYTKDGKLFCNKPGFLFIFFTSPSCQYCDNLKPFFNKMSTMVRGINFAYMDVEQNNYKIIRMTQYTLNEITYVPLLIMYLNGEPIAQYFPEEDNPQLNTQKMTDFISSFFERKQNQTQLQTFQGQQDNIFGGIPGNRASQKVCYLTYDNAYSKS